MNIRNNIHQIVTGSRHLVCPCGCSYKKLAVGCLGDVIYRVQLPIVVVHRERAQFIAVETIETVAGAYPDVSVLVFEYLKYRLACKTVLHCKAVHRIVIRWICRQTEKSQ